MNVAGFLIYRGAPFRDREHWEHYTRTYVAKDLAERTLLAAPYLEFWKFNEAKGFLASSELLDELNRLSGYRQPEFGEKLEVASDHLLAEVSQFLAGIAKRAGAQQTVPPGAVLDHLAAHNPFFARWLAFDRERPRRAPEDWEPYAGSGVAEEDREYAYAMRELGQTLRQMMAAGRRLTLFAATGLIHHDHLDREDRLRNLIVQMHMIQEDGCA